MTLVLCTGFFLFCGGILMLLDLTPVELLTFVTDLLRGRKKDLRTRIREARTPKKPKGLRLILREARTALSVTPRGDLFAQACVLSVGLFVLGILIAAALNNVFLMPVMGGGLCLLPFLFSLLLSARMKRRQNEELETVLSTITSSYYRTENIITAVEENLSFIEPPTKAVFQRFVSQTKRINPDITLALEQMKDSIDNSVFREWCDAMIDCQQNRTLKSTLTPIVNKLSDIRIVTGELDNLLYEPLKEYAVMASVLLGALLGMRFFNPLWNTFLMETTGGKMIVTICILVLFLSLIGAVRHTRPVDYRR